MIRKAGPCDADLLAVLAVQMWEDNDLAGLADDFRKLTAKDHSGIIYRYFTYI